MKRALVLAICLLMVGVGVSQANKLGNERSAPASTPSVGDPRSSFEGFEVSVPPPGWTLVQTNVLRTWYQSTLSYAEGFASAECDYDESYSGPQDEFLKFMAPITATDNHLNFQMMGSYYWSSPPYANYDMWVTINGTRIWSWVAMRNPAGVNWAWELFDIDLSAYIGNTIEIGFEYAGYDGAQGNLDAVGVNGGYVPPPTGACCDLLGACTLVVEASCLAPSTWNGSWTCSPNNCPQPPPITNDTCAGAIEICGDFNISGITTGAVNDYSPTNGCSDGYSEIGPDIVYYIDMVAGDIFTVLMQTDGWDDGIYLITDCANMASCVAGSDLYPTGSNFSYTVPAGPGGRYYLIVDGWGGANGAFTITGTAPCHTPPVPTEVKSWGAIKASFR